MKRLLYYMQHQSRQETLAYGAMWALLFVAPMLSLYVRTVNDTELTFDWHEVFIVWRQYAIYLLLFLLHNYLLAPLLVYRQKKVLYFSAVACLVGVFAFYQCNTHPEDMEQRRHLTEQKQPMMPGQMAEGQGASEGTELEQMAPPERMHEGPQGDEFTDHRPPPFDGDRPEMKPHDRPLSPQPPRDGPPLIFGQHDVIALIILILMFGMNLGIKYYFKARDDQKKLVALERENLEQQLEYLKYQINPHFFMNTLNNIHALVDIDPEKAKGTILELSKMMRFVLYEGDKNGVPLTREFDFISHYITLMKLRFTDRVKITLDLPTEAPDKLIPPLMLITFIENAFKHGISYQRDSFIDARVSIEQDRLHFECKNSKADKPNQEKGGVGLANVKQRLHLLYDNNFTLNIQDEPDTYKVELTIPLT